jgi:UDP:flavonoid glycosyltransferase YjiC (YdhE family)
MSGAFAAELIGVPWIEEIPHYLPDPDPALPPVGLGRTPSRRPLRRWDDARIRRRQSISVASGAALRDAARARLGIPASSGRVARLVANLPGLEHPRSRWPGDTHLVGPLSWDPPGEPLPVPPGHEPLVVVTDSSANTVPRSLGELALRGLRHAGIRLVVTTREPLDAWPAGCVVGTGPHEPLFAQADVILTPGGGGGLGKAFRHGVPVVVAPLQGDQREAAARVVAAGAGRRLRDWQWSPRLLRAAVVAVLHDERYRAGAERLQAQARGLGADHAARIVLAIAAGQRPVARGPQR